MGTVEKSDGGAAVHAKYLSGDVRGPVRGQKGAGSRRVHIPEQCRPLSKSNRLFVNLFRSMVGHTFVESHTFALEMTGKGYGRKDN